MVPQQFRFGRVVSDAALSVFRHAYFMQWRSGVVLSKWRRVVPDAAVSVILGHELFQLFVRSVHV